MDVEDKIYAFNDPSGFKQLAYKKIENKILLGSQPELFKHALTLKPTKLKQEWEVMCEKRFQNRGRPSGSNYLPAGITVYEETLTLMPNNYLDVSNLSQIRFWPRKPLGNLDVNKAAEIISDVLKKEIESISNRYNISISLSGGLDSRIILAASALVDKNIKAFTWNQPWTPDSDKNLPKKLCEMASIPHSSHILDKNDIDYNSTSYNNFKSAYLVNSDQINHKLIEQSYLKYLHSDDSYVSINGHAPGVYKCHYWNSGVHPKKIKSADLMKKEKEWLYTPSIKPLFEKWIFDLKAFNISKYHVKILDLLYWEHRSGGWQGNNKLLSNMTGTIFSPFSNRVILETALSVKPSKRKKPENILNKEILNHLMPELNSDKVKPDSDKNLSRARFKTVLAKTKLLPVYRFVRTKLQR